MARKHTNMHTYINTDRKYMHTFNVLFMKTHIYLYAYISTYPQVLDELETGNISKYKPTFEIYVFSMPIFRKELTLQGISETQYVPYI
jgi:hypothetical protein